MPGGEVADAAQDLAGLAAKVAIVTRAGSGPGRAIVRLFASLGAGGGSLGTVGVLVNPAGAGTLSTITDMLEEEWGTVLGVNLRGAFLGTGVFVSCLLRQGEQP